MGSIKKELENYPDISFIDDLTLETLEKEMISDFCAKYEEETGKTVELGLADPSRLILYAAALQIYQGMQYLDRAGKQSFLKYAYSGFLENLGALKGIVRNPGSASTATERFTVSEAQQNAITIPMGTRVTAGDNVYFYTEESVEIPAGGTYADAKIRCAEMGIVSNGYEVGAINRMVEPIAYIGSVANITKTEGGADAENDDQLAERIYLAPSSYSTAGPDDAYVYWTKTCNAGISDVKVKSPKEGVVEVRFILENGTIPGEAILGEVQQYLENEEIRPLTDRVEVKAPEISEYDITLTYYIAESDRNKVTSIRENVNNAIEAYKMWQMERIGRDLNPSYLTSLIVNAGAKRVVIQSPEFTVLPDVGIAICTGQTVTYGGLEID